MTASTEEILLAASIERVKLQKTIEAQKRVIAVQAEELKFTRECLNVWEMKELRRLEANGELPALLRAQGG